LDLIYRVGREHAATWISSYGEAGRVGRNGEGGDEAGVVMKIE